MKDPKILEIDTADDQVLETALKNAGDFGIRDQDNPWKKLPGGNIFDYVISEIVMGLLIGPFYLFIEYFAKSPRQRIEYTQAINVYDNGHQWFIQHIKAKYGVDISNKQKKLTDTVQKLAEFIVASRSKA